MLQDMCTLFGKSLNFHVQMTAFKSLYVSCKTVRCSIVLLCFVLVVLVISVRLFSFVY